MLQLHQNLNSYRCTIKYHFSFIILIFYLYSSNLAYWAQSHSLLL